MRWMLLLCLPLLCGCAGFGPWWQENRETIGDAAPKILGDLLSGDSAGAIGQTVDLALILLGIKGAQKAGQLVKKKIINPKEAQNAASQPV